MKLFEGSFRLRKKEELKKSDFWGFTPEIKQDAKKYSKYLDNIGQLLWFSIAIIIPVIVTRDLYEVAKGLPLLIFGLLISRGIAVIAVKVNKKRGLNPNSYDYFAITIFITGAIIFLINVL